MKERFQRVWTLSKNRKGFTLVELIVVIAILAILAGVAIPVYNGYIKKAQTAADQQLLDTIDTAFAAACLVNGIDHTAAVGELTINDNGTIIQNGPITLAAAYSPATHHYFASVTPLGSVTLAEFDASFFAFFAGNEEAKFSQTFVEEHNGKLIVKGSASAEGYIELKYGNSTITISAADAQKLANSTFNNKLGVEALLNKVNETATFAGTIDSTTYNAIVESDDFKKMFLENLGVDTSNLDMPLSAVFDEKYAEMSNAMMEKDPTLDRSTADAQVKANMAVLYAAQSTGSMTKTQIEELLYNDNPKGTILAGATDGTKLSQAALYYGMYIAYAQNSGDDALIKQTENPLGLFNSLTDENIAGFKDYLDKPEGKADLDAYLASMNMISDSANSNAGAVSNLVVNGFADEDLVKLLQDAVGK